MGGQLKIVTFIIRLWVYCFGVGGVAFGRVSVALSLCGPVIMWKDIFMADSGL